MKTSVIEVSDMLSVLSVLGVEKRIGNVPGVESVTVNHAAGTAAVRYDETRLQIADIRSYVRQGGLNSAEPDKATPLTAAPTPAIAPVPSPVAPASAGSQGTEQKDKAALAAAPEPAASRPIPPASPSVAASAPATARAPGLPTAKGSLVLALEDVSATLQAAKVLHWHAWRVPAFRCHPASSSPPTRTAHLSMPTRCRRPSSRWPRMQHAPEKILPRRFANSLVPPVFRRLSRAPPYPSDHDHH